MKASDLTLGGPATVTGIVHTVSLLLDPDGPDLLPDGFVMVTLVVAVTDHPIGGLDSAPSGE